MGKGGERPPSLAPQVSAHDTLQSPLVGKLAAMKGASPPPTGKWVSVDPKYLIYGATYLFSRATGAGEHLLPVLAWATLLRYAVNHGFVALSKWDAFAPLPRGTCLIVTASRHRRGRVAARPRARFFFSRGARVGARATSRGVSRRVPRVGARSRRRRGVTVMLTRAPRRRRTRLFRRPPSSRRRDGGRVAPAGRGLSRDGVCRGDSVRGGSRPRRGVPRGYSEGKSASPRDEATDVAVRARRGDAAASDRARGSVAAAPRAQGARGRVAEDADGSRRARGRVAEPEPRRRSRAASSGKILPRASSSASSTGTAPSCCRLSRSSSWTC